MDGGVEHLGVVGSLHLMGIDPAAEPCLHEFVEELDIFRKGGGQLIGRAVVIGRSDATGEAPVVERIVLTAPGQRSEMSVFYALPETEKLGHGRDEGGGLGSEDDGQLADRLFFTAVELNLIFHRGAIFIFKRALKRHTEAVGGEEGNQLRAGTDEPLHGGENVVNAALGRCIVYVFGENLIDQRRTIRPQTVSQQVNFPDDFVVEHQAV